MGPSAPEGGLRESVRSRGRGRGRGRELSIKGERMLGPSVGPTSASPEPVCGRRFGGYIVVGPAGQHPNASAFCLPPTLHPTQRPARKIHLGKQERCHLIPTRTAKVKKTGRSRAGPARMRGTRSRLRSGGRAEPL